MYLIKYMYNYEDYTKFLIDLKVKPYLTSFTLVLLGMECFHLLLVFQPRKNKEPGSKVIVWISLPSLVLSIMSRFSPRLMLTTPVFSTNPLFYPDEILYDLSHFCIY